jgi:O-antigen/teichoic acid export membrane protein
MASYGSANLAMRISELLAFQTDQFIIVQAAGPAAVAQYHIGRYLALHSRSLIHVLSMVVAPYFAALSVSGSPTEMRQFFLRTNRWICSLAFLLLSGVMAFGQPYLALWVGARYVQGDWWRRSDAVLVIFACAMAFRSLYVVPHQYLLGTRRLRVATLALAGEALFIAVAGVLAIRWKGIAGVALVKCISSFGLAVMLLLPYALREIGIPARRYLRSSLAPALITGAATAAAGVLFRVLFPVSGWLQLFFGAAVSACAGCVAFLYTATQEDREFLRRKLRTPLG